MFQDDIEFDFSVESDEPLCTNVEALPTSINTQSPASYSPQAPPTTAATSDVRTTVTTEDRSGVGIVQVGNDTGVSHPQGTSQAGIDLHDLIQTEPEEFTASFSTIAHTVVKVMSSLILWSLAKITLKITILQLQNLRLQFQLI